MYIFVINSSLKGDNKAPVPHPSNKIEKPSWKFENGHCTMEFTRQRKHGKGGSGDGSNGGDGDGSNGGDGDGSKGGDGDGSKGGDGSGNGGDGGDGGSGDGGGGSDDDEGYDLTDLDGFFIIYFVGGGKCSADSFSPPTSPPKFSDDKDCICTGYSVHFDRLSFFFNVFCWTLLFNER